MTIFHFLAIRGSRMANTPPGWYPYRPPSAGISHEQESWSDLVARVSTYKLHSSDDAAQIPKWEFGDRRYWDGSKWEGAAVPNTDFRSIQTCSVCERYTIFVSLTAEERRPYIRETYKETKRYAFRTGFLGGALFALTGKKSEEPDFSTELNVAIMAKCVDCSNHIGVCPICRMENLATPGKGKCGGCDIKIYYAG